MGHPDDQPDLDHPAGRTGDGIFDQLAIMIGYPLFGKLVGAGQHDGAVFLFAKGNGIDPHSVAVTRNFFLELRFH
jgi:hypothetical protein